MLDLVVALPEQPLAGDQPQQDLPPRGRHQPGDQISYYVTGTKAKVKISENCKLATQWNRQDPDENVEHYKAKLNELYEKFKPWIEFDNSPAPKGELAGEPLLL